MKTGFENKMLQINTPLRGHNAGVVIRVKVAVTDKNIMDEKKEKVVKTVKEFTPVDKYWRDRLKDSKHDKCVEFVAKKKENTLSKGDK